MALKKQITADNGVVTEYHRIALLSVDVHNQNTILVHSYLSANGRQVEKDYAAGMYKDVDAGMMKFPYVDAHYIHTDYDESMSIKGAYEYLKTMPQFEGATDI